MNDTKVVLPSELHNNLNRLSDVLHYFDSGGNFPFVVFNITDDGPNVAYKDFKNWPVNDSLNLVDEMIQLLAISYIAAIGAGHNYSSGVFELPAGNSKLYRMMIIAINCGLNKEKIASQQYFQFGLCIPQEVMKLMPSFISIEEIIMDSFHNEIPCRWDLSHKNLQVVKNHLITIILLSILSSG